MNLSNRITAETSGQGLLQLGEPCLALVLSSAIGLERELRMKSAGLRTHTLVGVAAALIMLVSKYGFTDVIARYEIVLDPSRVAAQIVSGIGFIGGGLIFVVYGYAPLERKLLSEHAELLVQYMPGKGAIQEIVEMCTGRGFTVRDLAVRRNPLPAEGDPQTIQLHVQGRRGVMSLVVAIGDIKG